MPCRSTTNNSSSRRSYCSDFIHQRRYFQSLSLMTTIVTHLHRLSHNGGVESLVTTSPTATTTAPVKAAVVPIVKSDGAIDDDITTTIMIPRKNSCRSRSRRQSHTLHLSPPQLSLVVSSVEEQSSDSDDSSSSSPYHHHHHHPFSSSLDDDNNLHPWFSIDDDTPITPCYPPSSSSSSSITTPLTTHQISHISSLLRHRADARRRHDYATADTIRQNVNSLLDQSSSSSSSSLGVIPSGYKIDIRDFSLSDGGGSKWRLCPLKLSGGGEGGGRRSVTIPDHDDTNNNNNNNNNNKNGESVLTIAHRALGLASIAADNDTSSSSSSPHVVMENYQNDLHRLTARAESLLQSSTHGLHGRQPSDAAFWFAIAGVTSPTLYSRLIQLSLDELQRRRQRRGGNSKLSKRRGGRVVSDDSMIIRRVIERLLAAGVRWEDDERLRDLAGGIIGDEIDDDGDEQRRRQQQWRRWEEMRLLTIFRFASRQRKQRGFLEGAQRHYSSMMTMTTTTTVGVTATSIENQRQSDTCKNNHDNEGIESDIKKDAEQQQQQQQQQRYTPSFTNTTLPLIIDIGCGMGVSLLGLSQSSTTYDASLQPHNNNDDDDNHHHHHHHPLSHLDYQNSNHLGIDLSRLAIGYANSIAHRWGLDHCVQFVAGHAEKVLRTLEYRMGMVDLIMIQFPTPFQWDKGRQQQQQGEEEEEEEEEEGGWRGNSQLPPRATEGFMVTESLLHLCHERLLRLDDDCCGHLLLQSNCEDVAVYLRKLAESVGFECVTTLPPGWDRIVPPEAETTTTTAATTTTTTTITKRMERWVTAGGERAVGKGWCRRELLPEGGVTETEVACRVNGVPVHRCLLRPKKERLGG